MRATRARMRSSGVIRGVFKYYLASKEILALKNTRLLVFVCLLYLALEPGRVAFPRGVHVVCSNKPFIA